VPKQASRTLLIVEDDPGLQSQMRWCFDNDVAVVTAERRDSAVAALRREQPEVVTLDLGLPPDPGGAEEGFAALEEIVSLAPETKVIVITGREETDNAVRAIALGAHDFYQKPVDADTLRFVVERAFKIHELELENRRLQEGSRATPLDGVIASSEAMLKVCRNVEKVGPADVTTLVLGETGTGKELIARALHRLSGRREGPFVTINCAAIPENLLESELFGYEKGAFTGASAQKKGKIEHANQGTLFLDEIGDMPLHLQAKILRFLQERCVERVGGHEPIAVDVRVVCATHRDLETMVREETFREDLYYRISEIAVTLPPMRARPGDSILVANSLLKRFASEHNVKRMRFSPEARDAIEAWEWPGNVREMENRIKRAVILSDSEIITADDLELDPPGETEALPFNLRQAREHAEREVVARALGAAGGNVSEAARLLGITRPTLYNLMGKYALDKQVDEDQQVRP